MRQLIRRIEALEDKIKPSKEYQQEVDRWADLFGMAEVDDPQVMAKSFIDFCTSRGQSPAWMLLHAWGDQYAAQDDSRFI